MTKRLNPNIAKALDMELPEEPPVEDSAPLVVVEPHEIITLENPNLPDMSDIETKTLEGEKQLELLIERGMGMFSELYEELPEIDPKYRNRHLEITALIMGNTLDAIKHKTEYQIKRKKARLEEAGFGGAKESGGTQINHFYGSREEVMTMIENATNGEAPPDDESQ